MAQARQVRQRAGRGNEPRSDGAGRRKRWPALFLPRPAPGHPVLPHGPPGFSDTVPRQTQGRRRSRIDRPRSPGPAGRRNGQRPDERGHTALREEREDRASKSRGRSDRRAAPYPQWFPRSGQGQNRTADPRFFRPILYQLSYLAARPLAGTTGFEPATSGLTGQRTLQTVLRPRINRTDADSTPTPAVTLYPFTRAARPGLRSRADLTRPGPPEVSRRESAPSACLYRRGSGGAQPRDRATFPSWRAESNLSIAAGSSSKGNT